MKYELEEIKHSLSARFLLFTLQPMNILFMYIYIQLWRLMSYGPSHLQSYFPKEKARDVVFYLWDMHFSGLWLWFLVALAADFLLKDVWPRFFGGKR